MKSICVYLFLWISLPSFAGVKCLPVKVSEATELHWVSGAPGGRSGTKFSIKLLIKTSDKVEFVNVWLGSQNVPFNLELFSQETQQPIKEGDSVLLTYNQINHEADTDFRQKRAPMEYKGAALIECLINGKAQYLIVKSFRKLEDSRSE